MANPLRFLLVGLLLSAGLAAQVTTELLPTANESAPPLAIAGEYSGWPFNTYWHDQRLQSLYLASELNAAGLSAGAQITSISLKCAQLPGRAVANFRVRMGHTSQATVLALSDTGLSVHFGPQSLPVSSFAVNAWRALPLASPFVWNGSDNVFIDFTTDDSSWSHGGGCFVRDAGPDRSRYGYSDSLTSWPFDNIGNQSESSLVPSMRLEFIPGSLSVTTPAVLPQAIIAQGYQQDLQAAAGTPPYTWTLLSGSLPAGISLTQQGDVFRLSGTSASSAAEQTHHFTVRVQDAASAQHSRAFSLHVQGVRILNASPLPTAAEGVAWTQTFTAVNGTLPYQWSQPTGSIPAGLSWSIAGDSYVLSGTPGPGTGGQAYNFELQAQEAGGAIGQKAYSLSVIEPPNSLPFVDDFSTDKGWQLGSGSGGGSPPVTSWQRGPCGPSYTPPYGLPEPTTDVSAGTDNHILGTNIGAVYSNSLLGTIWATSPAVDCTGVNDVELSFWRWLSVEQASFDRAFIEVSPDNGATWTRIWQNASTISENTWTRHSFNISAIAGNKAAVSVRFGIGPTDSSWQFAGWCIDDFEIRELPATDRLVLTDFQMLSPYTLGSQNDPRVFTGTQVPFELAVDNTTPNDITVDALVVSVVNFTNLFPDNVGSFTLNPAPPIVVPANTTGFVLTGQFDCTQLASAGANATLEARALLQGTEAITAKPVETQIGRRFYVDQGPPPPPPALEVRESTSAGALVEHSQPAAGTARDFGSVDIDAGPSPLAWQNIYIVNNLGEPVHVDQPVLAGPDAAHFRLDATQWTSGTMLLSTTGASSRIFFSLRFDPHDVGVLDAWIEFSHDASNPATTPFRVLLTGVGTGAPPALQVHEFDFTGPQVVNSQPADGNRDFGGVADGGFSNWLLLVLWNRFASATTIDPAPALSGPDAAEFELFFYPGEVQTGGFVIPGTTAFTGQTFFAVRFKPASTGVKNATLTFGHDASNPVGAPLPGGFSEFSIALRGEGVAASVPLLRVTEATGPASQGGSPTLHVGHDSAAEYGREFAARTISAGPSTPLTVRIFNPGGVSLVLGAPSVNGDASFFVETGSPWAYLTSVPPGGFADFAITFNPSSAGAKAATIAFTHGDTRHPSPYQFHVAGVGRLDAPEISVRETGPAGPPVAYNAPAAGTSRDFGSRDVNGGASAGLTIHLENTGTQDLALQTPTLGGADPAEFQLGVSGLATSVPPGMSTTFTVYFNPAVYGAKSAYVLIPHDDPQTAAPFRFEVAGFGDAPALEVREQSASGPLLIHDIPPAGGRDFGTVQIAAMPSAPTQIVLVNAGNADLQVQAPTLMGANASDFSVSTSGFPAVIAPGQHFAFALRFDAAQVGLKEASIQLIHNSPGAANPFILPVRGTAADPNGVRITTSPTLPQGRVGAEYGPLAMQASGGAMPYNWALRPGSDLPEGLSMNGVGAITGKPTGPAGIFSFELRVTDANGGTSDQAFSLTIQPAPGQGFSQKKPESGCAALPAGAPWLLLVLLLAAARCGPTWGRGLSRLRRR